MEVDENSFLQLRGLAESGKVLIGVHTGGAADFFDKKKKEMEEAIGEPASLQRNVVVGLVKFFTRYGILAAVAYVIMARLRLPPVAVIAGASSLVIAIMLEAVRSFAPNPRQHR